MLKIMSSIYKNRFIYKFHVCLYVALIFYDIACMAISLESHGQKMQVWEFIVILGVAVAMIVTEHIGMKDPERVQKHYKFCFVYQLFRVACATVAYYFWKDFDIAPVFFALLVLFSIETFVFVPYDDNMKRVSYYLTFLVLYVIQFNLVISLSIIFSSSSLHSCLTGRRNLSRFFNQFCISSFVSFVGKKVLCGSRNLIIRLQLSSSSSLQAGLSVGIFSTHSIKSCFVK